MFKRLLRAWDDGVRLSFTKQTEARVNLTPLEVAILEGDEAVPPTLREGTSRETVRFRLPPELL